MPAPPAGSDLPSIELIISDEEFEREVPALDPAADTELKGPLESIAEFEARVVAEQSAAASTAGQAAPLGASALADGDPAETIGDAPVRDAELVAPLPPIDQFEVEPVRLAEAEVDEALVEIAYRVEIDGLDAADDETETDLRDMFDGLSALEDGDGKAANVAQVAARLTEDSALMQRILASEGWYEARATTRVDRRASP